MHRVKNMRSRVSDRHLAALGSVPCSIEDPITTNQNNIFGKRQDPNGAYAAVIHKWVDSLLKGDDVFINGDGETSRDFCYIDNAVQANLLAATVEDEPATNQVYNVAVGERTTLNQLYSQIKDGLTANCQRPTWFTEISGQVMCATPLQTSAKEKSCWATTQATASKKDWKKP